MATATGGRRLGSAAVELALPALTVTLGLQLLRLEIATVISVERDRLGAPITALAGYAIGSLLLAFLAPLVVRALGQRLALALTCGGVAVVRLALQLIPVALARWLIAPVGVVLFCWFVPCWLGRVRGTPAGRRLGVAVLCGFAIDTALQGAAGTYDGAWTIDAATVALAALLAGLLLWLLVLALRGTPASAGGAPVEAPAGGALPLAGFGPALFLNALVLQNVGWQSVLGHQRDTAAFLLVMLANLVALAIGGALTAATRRPGWAVTLAGIAAVALSVALQRRAGVAALFCGQAGAAVLLVGVFRAAGAAGERRGLARTGGAWGLGVLLFGVLLFLYYAGYDVVLPFDNKVMFPVAAALLSLAGAAAARPPAIRAAGDRPALVAPVALGLVLLLGPLGLWLATPAALAATGDGYPVTVMSYNLHFGYDVTGWSDLESTARTIERSDAEIVGLEEVSRGWYINGATDMLSWLQRRLRMPYVVFGGASDAIWGNAILSRHPITASGVVPLPRGGVPLRRNYLWANVDLGGGQRLRVISTHLHQVEGEEGAPVRLAQVPKLLEAWARSSATVIMGDFNATPDSREAALMRDAGLKDAWVAAGGSRGDELTYASNRRYERIDYVWLSPDLRGGGFAATTATASDHRGIMVTLDR